MLKLLVNMASVVFTPTDDFSPSLAVSRSCTEVLLWPQGGTTILFPPVPSTFPFDFLWEFLLTLKTDVLQSFVLRPLLSFCMFFLDYSRHSVVLT